MAKATCGAKITLLEAIDPKDSIVRTCALPKHSDSTHQSADGDIWDAEVETMTGTLEEPAAEPE